MGVVVAVALGALDPAGRVLIVGSNESATPGRTRLSYADDDAVKYAQLFRALLGPAAVTVLTHLDADTRALFPDARVDGRPTRAQVLEALAAWRSAAAQDERTEFTFVFAGHGDVDHGTGVLELEDGPLISAEFQAALEAVRPHRVHVILDSCNSFFMLTPRKAGGRRYATPEDVKDLFEHQLPHVGVVLSTSAENEVYEWGSIQSGIFSHLVRTAAAGFADANQDGVVTYGELGAMLAVGVGGLVNPAFRPRLYVKGQAGPDTPLFRVSAARAPLFTYATVRPTLVSVRDGNGVRWFDARLEANHQVRVVVAEATLELDDGAQTLRLLPTDAPPSQARQVARGPGEIPGLWASPFGPQAFEAWRRRPAEAEVFGLARSEVARLGTLIEAYAAQAADRRLVVWLGLGASLGLEVATAIFKSLEDPATMGTSLVVGWAASSASVGIAWLQAAQYGHPNRLRALATQLASSDDPAKQLVAVDAEVQQMAKSDARLRRLEVILGAVGLGLGATALVLNEVGWARAPQGQGAGLAALTANRISEVSLMAQCLALMLQGLLVRGQQAFYELWNQDPARPSPLGVRAELFAAPTSGGAVLGVSGQF